MRVSLNAWQQGQLCIVISLSLLSLRHTRGDSCQFRVPRLSPVMDEPVSFSHLGCVIEALVVSQPHACSHKVKKVTCPALKALQHFTQTVVWRTLIYVDNVHSQWQLYNYKIIIFNTQLKHLLKQKSQINSPECTAVSKPVFNLASFCKIKNLGMWLCYGITIKFTSVSEGIL